MERSLARTFARIGALALVVLPAACAAPDADEPASASADPLSISGTTNPTTSSWQTFPFTANAGDRIDATLDWDNAAADLNVYLYDPTGTVVAYENSKTAKPSRTSTTAKLSGNWKVAVKCHDASAKFTIDLKVTPPAPIVRFPGDPGKGKVYLGASVASQAANGIDTIEANLAGKKFGMIRLYYSDTISWSNVDAHIAKNRIPAVSFKIGSKTLANIAGGKEDAWIDGIGAEIKKRAPVPLFMTFYHEPEDNFANATEAASYRAASRRIVSRWRAAGVKNFTNVADYYMTSWTFSAASGRDWRWWYPDWKGTTAAGSSKDAPNAADFYAGADSVVDVVGYDIYNWWDPTQAASKWTSFQTHADVALARLGVLGKPYCVGEYGTMAFRSGTTYDATKTKAWFTDAYTYMLTHDFVCAMYWNNDHSDDAWDPRMETNDPQKLRYSAMTDILGRSGTAAVEF